MSAAASTTRATLSALLRRMAGHAAELQAELGSEPDTDALIQAAVCAAPILAAATQNTHAALTWLRPQLSAWEKISLRRALVLSTQYSVLATQYPVPTTTVHAANPPNSLLSHPHTLTPSHPPTSHLYDHFLHLNSKSTRKRHGVFFTPQPIADYIVTQIDRLLREDFHFSDGLASQSKIENRKSKICFLDPACGTGVFLLTLIDHIHRRVPPRHFNALVPNLLSRCIGIEILPAAALLCKLNISLKLAESGYDFSHPCKLRIITGDALSLKTQSKIQNRKPKILPVLLGNPPFSSLSTNTNPWISRLIRGDDEIRGYIRANGQQLNERKTWLHDDYVKFIRLAQWHIEQAGAGIVGFVTNHGYLDNATFRLMRHELLRVFSKIQILDLHGNRRACGAGVSPAIPTRSVSERGLYASTPSDENVFGLDQGVAIGLFCAPLPVGEGVRRRRTGEGIASAGGARSIRHSDLRGSRKSKLAALTSVPCPLTPVCIVPSTPDWRFVPTEHRPAQPEYDQAWSLADAMPVHTTAPVTARDHFVVAFTRDELILRLEQFRDLSIPDAEIRNRFFTRTRSARYPTGDTRGWKLTEARRTIAAEENWQRHIARCLYRPFDWRYIFWHPAMIDWPRQEVTRHLVDDPSAERGSRNAEQGEHFKCSALRAPRSTLCLIARRQQLPSQPCTYFWISDGLAVDGVIRSDNRGSESLFPLALWEREAAERPGEGITIGSRANFAPAFIDQFAAATQLDWQPTRGDLQESFSPEDLLAYIYALFHSPTYRHRYANALRNNFPRILAPKNHAQFAAMTRLGHELISLHAFQQNDSVLSTQYSVFGTLEDSSAATQHSALVTPQLPDALASFRAGGYPALKKWLQPKHRSSADPDYARIAAAIASTLKIMPQIDEVITRYGGSKASPPSRTNTKSPSQSAGHTRMRRT